MERILRHGRILSMPFGVMGERRCRKAGDLGERQIGYDRYKERNLRNARWK